MGRRAFSCAGLYPRARFWKFSLMVADVGIKSARKSEAGCREGGMDAAKA